MRTVNTQITGSDVRHVTYDVSHINLVWNNHETLFESNIFHIWGLTYSWFRVHNKYEQIPIRPFLTAP